MCLDVLRSRTARREEPLGVHLPEPIVRSEDGTDPEQEALLAEGVGLALLVVLDVVARADLGAVPAGASREVRGAAAVAGQALSFARFAQVAQPALVNGAAGVVVARGGRPFAVLGFTITGGKIVEIDILADHERLRQLDLAVLDDEDQAGSNSAWLPGSSPSQDL